MSNLPTDPDFLPIQEVPRMEWGMKFGSVIGVLGPKYGLPTSLIEAVEANTVVLTVFKTNFDKSKTFAHELVGNKNSLMLINPPDPNLLVTLQPLPVFTAWPAGPIKVGILTPHLQAAVLLSANKDLTTADRTAAGLNKLPVKPSTRPTAEDYNYPFMSYTVENNMIILRIKRGNRFKGKICRIMLDLTGNGTFTLVTNTTAKSINIPVHIPLGKIASTMVIQAVYKEGEANASDWSPWLVIPVQKSNAPDMEALAA